MRSAPLVGITACNKAGDALPCQTVGLKYIDAIADASGALPVLVPALGARLSTDDLLAHLDGLFLTGSPSNVDPRHYDGTLHFDPGLLDPARDATTLPLIQAAIAQGVPLLAVCRGFQELNVALGGSLHQQVQSLPGHLDHRANDDAPLDQQYGMVHSVTLEPGGKLRDLLNGVTQIQVNSLHAQGIDRLADALAVEARAPDGLIEAVCVRNASTFAMGVQWHPEWQVMQNLHSLAIFRAFGAACRARQQQRALSVQMAAPPLQPATAQPPVP